MRNTTLNATSFMNMSLDATTLANNASFRRFSENPSDTLFADFKDCLLLHSHNVFNIMKSFDQLCSDQVDCLQHAVRFISERVGFDRSIFMLRLIQAELHTWRLTFSLYHDRLLNQPKEMISFDEAVSDHLEMQSDAETHRILKKLSLDFRELLLLVDWCEKNSADEMKSESLLNFLSENNIHWQNTLKNLFHNGKNDTRLISCLDPDAVTRECKQLDDKDAIDEKKFLQACLAYIRSGQLQKALELCVYCGQSWRAATFQGGQLYNDPNIFDLKDGDLIKPIEGNRNRRLWKSMCWKLSQNPECSTVERAIYGSLCGNLAAILLSCDSWVDCLWAYCSAGAESLFVDFGLTKSLPADPTNGTSRIFDDLEASNKEQVRQESTDPYRILQKYIALNKPNLAVEYMHDYVGSNPDLNGHVLRFMAHLVLVLDKCGLQFQKYFANGILEAYVSSLIDDKRLSLVATYASFLPERVQIECYSRFLQGISLIEEQKFCLRLAEESGLDLSEICLAVVQRIKDECFNEMLDFSAAQNPAPENGDELDELISRFTSNENLNQNEDKLVKSVQWLLFYDNHRTNALEQANTIARRFLVLQNVKAVKKLFAQVPSDSLALARQIWAQEDIEMTNNTTLLQNLSSYDIVQDLSIPHQNCAKEYLSIIAYLNATEAFAEWFDQFHRRRPERPEILEGDETTLSFVQKATRQHTLQQFEQDLQQWRQTLQICTERAVKSLYNVLLFPDGGWFKDRLSNNQEIDMNDERTTTMNVIRRKYIPLTSTMILTILAGVGDQKQALQMADFIASEDRCLYKEFSKDQLRILLNELSKVSTSSLTEDKDFLGY